MRSLSAIRDRIARLLSSAPAVVATSIDTLKERLGEEASRALLEEFLAYQRGLSEAIAKLPRKSTAGWPGVWRLEDDQLDQVFQVMDPNLLNRMLKLTHALDAGVLVVSLPDGSLSAADAERVRAAEAEGRPTFALNFVPPLELMGIDVKAELAASANRGNVPNNVEMAG